jgi:hypothetical protein
VRAGNRVTNQEDATALYGDGAIYRPNGYTYTASSGKSITLGDYGFFKRDGNILSSPDLAQNSLAFTNPAQSMALADGAISGVKAKFAGVIGIRSAQAADVATPDPSDGAWPKWVGHAIVFASTAYYISKMNAEIEGISRRAGGANGWMYSLNAVRSGTYPIMTRGSRVPTGTTILGVGGVWKFGQTTDPSRYRDAELRSIGQGVMRTNLVPGNTVQIRIAEKIAIYGYFLQNGHLPPGNKIFR